MGDSFQSRSAEYAPVKYGGPIVYSGEKPPIIHFPPPPRDTQSYGGGGNGGSPPSIKYVPLPHHDLPVLIYTSDSQPPIHVVHTPRPHVAKTNYQEEEKPVYKKRPPPPPKKQKQTYQAPAPKPKAPEKKPAYKKPPPPPPKKQAPPPIASHLFMWF